MSAAPFQGLRIQPSLRYGNAMDIIAYQAAFVLSFLFECMLQMEVPGFLDKNRRISFRLLMRPS